MLSNGTITWSSYMGGKVIETDDTFLKAQSADTIDCGSNAHPMVSNENAKTVTRNGTIYKFSSNLDTNTFTTIGDGESNCFTINVNNTHFRTINIKTTGFRRLWNIDPGKWFIYTWAQLPIGRGFVTSDHNSLYKYDNEMIRTGTHTYSKPTSLCLRERPLFLGKHDELDIYNNQCGYMTGVLIRHRTWNSNVFQGRLVDDGFTSYHESWKQTIQTIGGPSEPCRLGEFPQRACNYVDEYVSNDIWPFFTKPFCASIPDGKGEYTELKGFSDRLNPIKTTTYKKFKCGVDEPDRVDLNCKTISERDASNFMFKPIAFISTNLKEIMKKGPFFETPLHGAMDTNQDLTDLLTWNPRDAYASCEVNSIENQSPKTTSKGGGSTDDVGFCCRWDDNTEGMVDCKYTYSTYTYNKCITTYRETSQNNKLQYRLESRRIKPTGFFRYMELKPTSILWDFDVYTSNDDGSYTKSSHSTSLSTSTRKPVEIKRDDFTVKLQISQSVAIDMKKITAFMPVTKNNGYIHGDAPLKIFESKINGPDQTSHWCYLPESKDDIPKCTLTNGLFNTGIDKPYEYSRSSDGLKQSIGIELESNNIVDKLNIVQNIHTSGPPSYTGTEDLTSSMQGVRSVWLSTDYTVYSQNNIVYPTDCTLVSASGYCGGGDIEDQVMLTISARSAISTGQVHFLSSNQTQVYVHDGTILNLKTALSNQNVYIRVNTVDCSLKDFEFILLGTDTYNCSIKVTTGPFKRYVSNYVPETFRPSTSAPTVPGKVRFTPDTNRNEQVVSGDSATGTPVGAIVGAVVGVVLVGFLLFVYFSGDFDYCPSITDGEYD